MGALKKAIVVLLALSLNCAHAQLTQIDSLYWWTTLVAREKQILRHPLDSLARVRLQTEDGSKEGDVQTILDALNLLGDSLIEVEGVFRLYDLLDSAAAYFYHQGAPTLIMAPDFYRPAAQLLEIEAKRGVQYVLAPVDYHDARQLHGVDVFGLRTVILLHPQEHPKAKREMSALRKRFVVDERNRRKAEKALNRKLRW